MSDSNKARIYGLPGEHARASGVMRAGWPLLAAFFACGFFIGAILPRVDSGLVGAGLLGAAFFLLWAMRDGMKGVDAYFKGARGEERVAVQLEALPKEFHVFHDVTIDGHGVDHVVVGPSGVFCIETKCWAGAVTFEQGHIRVNGKLPSRPPLTQARRVSHAVNDYLLERIGAVRQCTPVLCFASDTFQADILRVEDVSVCNVSALPAVVMVEKNRLVAEEIEQIVKILEPEKWL